MVRGRGAGGLRPGAIVPRDAEPPPNVVTVEPGTSMADVERMVIEAALKETRGNRRRAAELLGIGERTLYRKIKEYKVPRGDPGRALTARLGYSGLSLRRNFGVTPSTLGRL